MARTVQECYSHITVNLVSQFSAVGITINPNTWSTRNLLRLICYTTAIAMSVKEQIMDVYLAKMQEVQSLSAAASLQWLQDKAFKFQYSSTTPQYLTVLNGVTQYAVVNPALCIVTACAASVTSTGNVLIKAAKGSTTLSALSAPEISALQDYFNQIGTAGIPYIVSSVTSDKLYLEGTIYYKGIYSAVIQSNVIAAIDAYLYNLSKDKDRFGGDILSSDIKNLVRTIEGVNDVHFERISCRRNSQAVLTGIDLVLAGDEIVRKYTSEAGYLVQETTATYTFADKLTFTPE
jgi:hypothetical protein